MQDDDRLPLWVLIQTSHVVTRAFSAVFASAGLTPTQFGVLNRLDHDPNATRAELARRVLIRPQSMGELVASLLDRGLVEREGPGGRGRPARLTLTDAGREALAEARPRVEALNAPVALGITDDEARTLVRLLRTVTVSIQSPPANCPQP